MSSLSEEDVFKKVNLKNATRRQERLLMLIDEALGSISEAQKAIFDPTKSFPTYVTRNLQYAAEKIEKAHQAAVRNEEYSILLRLMNKENFYAKPNSSTGTEGSQEKENLDLQDSPATEQDKAKST